MMQVDVPLCSAGFVKNGATAARITARPVGSTVLRRNAHIAFSNDDLAILHVIPRYAGICNKPAVAAARVITPPVRVAALADSSGAIFTLDITSTR